MSKRADQVTRPATHAGSWYSDNGPKLQAELERYLAKVHPLTDVDFSPPITDARAIIAPHAGYSYSGPAAAWAYASIDVDKIQRVFLLGPSHHAYLSGAALSTFTAYGTPLGDLKLCGETIAKLRATGAFSSMSPSVDEDEHSLEMHLPYIRHVFAGRDDIRLVPILIGHPSANDLTRLNLVLAEYWKDPGTFFIISSDFCHWGTRFSCTPYYPNAPSPSTPVPPVSPSPSSSGETSPPSPLSLTRRFNILGPTPIWKSIQYMDHEGMDILRRPADPGADQEWEAYLERTKNTICGRNPITVLVSLLQHLFSTAPADTRPFFSFVRYEQSSRCETGRDSSVSYVSGVLRMPDA